MMARISSLQEKKRQRWRQNRHLCQRNWCCEATPSLHSTSFFDKKKQQDGQMLCICPSCCFFLSDTKENMSLCFFLSDTKENVPLCFFLSRYKRKRAFMLFLVKIQKKTCLYVFFLSDTKENMSLCSRNFLC